MQDDRLLAAFATDDVPTDGPVETLDARELPPPKPLTETLERLATLGDDALLVQVNDRAPQHLYPKLEERGYAFETRESDAGVLTAIWSSA